MTGLPQRPARGTAGKYGTIMTEHGDPGRDGEPVFILRAKDVLAPMAIRAYMDLCVAAGCDEKHLEGITAQLEEFASWAEANKGRLTIPGPLESGGFTRT